MMTIRDEAPAVTPKILREIQHMHELIDDILAEVRARRDGRVG